MPVNIALRDHTKIIKTDRRSYWQFYGLRFDPFASQIKSDDACDFPKWEQYFDLINYLISSSNVLITVTGVKGIGKTIFKQQYIAQLEASTQLCDIFASSALDEPKLCALLVKNFGLSPPVQGDSLQEQFEFLTIQLQHCSSLCLLIIDDAHHMSEKTLNILISIIKQQSEAQMRLHILLLGLPELKEMIDRNLDSHEQELVHQLVLENLNREATQSYIKQRLTNAGLPAGMPLSASKITDIHNRSEGIPSRINVVARQALIDGMRQPQINTLLDFIKARSNQCLGGSVFIVLVIILAFFLACHKQAPHWPSFNGFQTLHQQSASYKNNAESTSVAKASKELLPQPIIFVDNRAIMSKNKSNGLAVKKDDTLDEILATAIKHDSKDQSAVTTKAPTVNTTSVSPVTAITEMRDNDLASDLAPVLVSTNTKSNNITTVAPPVKKVAVNFVKPVEEERADTTTKPINIQTILNADPHHYTLQLIGVSNEQKLTEFIKANRLKEKVIYIHTYRNDKDWYILIYGDYKTSQAAQAAIKKLPQTVQDQNPWPRTIASVQGMMHKFKDQNG